MRIAFMVPEFPRLSETFILSQITGLIDRGHEVDIYAQRPLDSGKVHQAVEEYDLPRRTHYQPRFERNRLRRVIKGLGLLGCYGWRNPRLVVGALNVLRYGKHAASLNLLHGLVPLLDRPVYDIVHCHFGPVGLRSSLLRDLGAIKGRLVTSFHGYDVNSYPREHGQNVYAELFRQGDWFTANTSFTAGQATALGCPPHRITILPVGLDLSRFKFATRTRQTGEPIKILTVGRLVEKKGLEYGIRAVGKVAQTHRHVQYRIVGDGPLRSALVELVAALGLTGNVALLGGMTESEVLRVYADSHIFMLPSVTASDGDQEGQGLVLQEAQAVGLPVLSTLHNGIPDGVLDGESGFLVPERDADALAERLTHLIDTPQRWGDMGREGRALVERSFDIHKLNDRLVEAYARLLS